MVGEARFPKLLDKEQAKRLRENHDASFRESAPRNTFLSDRRAIGPPRIREFAEGREADRRFNVSG